MYLGVHTPLDVGVSLLLALALLLLFRPLFATEERFNKAMPWIVIASTLLSVGFLAYVLSVSGDTGLDAENYNNALKNACTLLGCTAGLIVVYFLDSKFIKFETEARWYAQLLKLAIG